MKARIQRMSLRRKLAVGYAIAMALVLATTAVVVEISFQNELEFNIDASLRAQADALATVVAREGNSATGSAVHALVSKQAGFAQVLSPGGHIETATEAVEGIGLLPKGKLAAASRGTIVIERKKISALGKQGKHIRMAAEPVRVRGLPLRIVVVGRSVRDRERGIDSLGSAMAIAFPLGLLLALIAGYIVSALVVRPVEQMRRRAETLSLVEPGARLPVPEGGDELAALGESLNDMIARLERSFVQERALTSQTKAQLHAPLESLRAELQTALAHKRPVEEMEAALQAAATETDRLVRLAEELLVVARADEGTLPVELEQTDLSWLMVQAGERVRVRAADSHREVEVVIRRTVPIRADPEQLGQALDNLLDNAFVYGAGRIRLFPVARNGDLEVHVTDEGPGFPDSFLSRAFERFTRADPTEGRGGAGFGLAVVEAVAHAHGGHAGAANRPRGGADVWISLPREPPANDS
jgi:two-component system OmpR family sensor kinase